MSVGTGDGQTLPTGLRWLRVDDPRRAGAIINVASIGGLVGFPNAASYVASKHAVVGLTKGACGRLGPVQNPRECSLPGMTWSYLSRRDFEKNPNHYADRIRGSRWVKRESRRASGSILFPRIRTGQLRSWLDHECRWWPGRLVIGTQCAAISPAS